VDPGRRIEVTGDLGAVAQMVQRHHLPGGVRELVERPAGPLSARDGPCDGAALQVALRRDEAGHGQPPRVVRPVELLLAGPDEQVRAVRLPALEEPLGEQQGSQRLGAAPAEVERSSQ
jgi:hypothetical protein